MIAYPVLNDFIGTWVIAVFFKSQLNTLLDLVKKAFVITSAYFIIGLLGCIGAFLLVEWMLWPYLLFLIVSWVGTGYELYLQVKFLLGIAGDFRKACNFGEKLNFVADGKCGQVFDKLEQYLWGGAAILLTLHGLTWICVAILIHRIRADNERGSDEESKLRSLAHFEKRTLAASQRQGLLSASQSARARRLLSEPEKAFALPRAEERWASLDKTATRHARSNRRRRPKRRLEQSFQT